jgi:hypothetical protein
MIKSYKNNLNMSFYIFKLFYTTFYLLFANKYVTTVYKLFYINLCTSWPCGRLMRLKGLTLLISLYNYIKKIDNILFYYFSRGF